MIEFRNVTAIRKKRTLLDRMSFKLNNGRIYGITGESAVVSTVAELLAGAAKPVDGAVLINGFDLQREANQAKRFLGFVPAKNALYEAMTPVEYLLFLADVRQFEYEQSIRRVGEMLSLVGLSHKRGALISTLTEYEKRCLMLSQAYLCDTSILILSEPFSSLESSEAEKLSSLIRELSFEKTVIACSAQKHRLNKLCDVIYTATASALLDRECAKDSTHEKSREKRNEEEDTEI